MSSFGDLKKFAKVLGAGAGTPGKSVELQKTATAVQWRQVGGTWADLVPLSAITGNQGLTGNQGPAGVAVSPFWGVNGHLTWSWSPNATPYFKVNWAIACLRMLELNTKIYRNGYSWYYQSTSSSTMTGSDGNTFVDFITNFANPCGIQVAPVLLPSYDNTSFTNEAGAYSFAYAAAVEMATKLKGLVPWYELANEIEVWSLTGRGNYFGDYDNTKFMISRGILRGLYDGIKSVDTVTPIMSPGGTWVHTSFYDNLLTGKQPDGTTGHPTLNWDLTSWHWYVKNFVGNDDIENLQGQGTTNVLAVLAGWGKPIYITECGAYPSYYNSVETDVSNAITGNYLLSRFWAVRNTYNIKHVSLYQLFDAASPGVGSTDDEMTLAILANDGLTKKGRYTAFQNFVKLHQQ